MKIKISTATTQGMRHKGRLGTIRAEFYLFIRYKICFKGLTQPSW